MAELGHKLEPHHQPNQEWLAVLEAGFAATLLPDAVVAREGFALLTDAVFVLPVDFLAGVV